MKRGKAIIIAAIGILAIAASVAFLSVGVDGQPIIGNLNKFGANDTQTTEGSGVVVDAYREDTKVTAATKTVKSSRSVDFLSETYYLAANEKRIISFSTAEADTATIIGTAEPSGAGMVTISVTTDVGSCSVFGCESETVRGPTHPMAFSTDNDISLYVSPGASQKLVLENKSSNALSLTLDLDIVYSATNTVDASGPDQAPQSQVTPPESLINIKKQEIGRKN